MSIICHLSFDEAADLIDIYGPDDVFWPEEDKAALNRMIANDRDFRDYVDDAKWLESMLENWEQDDDGAGIDMDFDEDEDDDDASSDRSDPFDNDDGGDDDSSGAAGAAPTDAPPPPEHDFDKDSLGGRGAGSSGDLSERDEESEPEQPQPEADEQPEDAEPIEIDPEDIKDLDSMFQDFVRQQVEAADPSEFRVFTRDYDDLVDIKMPDHVSMESIDAKVALTTGPLQKDLRRLIAARSQVKRIPGMRNGRLHAPNLHRIMAGDDRVFTRRQEADSLDTAITLLIDASGSMSGSGLTLATEAAYAIGSVLAKLGIAFECLGFTDNASDPRIVNKGYIADVQAADSVVKIIRAVPITMPKFKTFEERWTIPVMRRFGHVHNMKGQHKECGINLGSTPEGCGLEFAARRLLGRKEKRKILISMTDGEPGGHVYNPRGYDDYLSYQKQSATVVKSIEASGIDLIGVGIEHDGPTGYYANSMVINRIDDMPKQLLALIKRFIVG